MSLKSHPSYSVSSKVCTMVEESAVSPLEDNQKLQDELDALNAQITKQASLVRQLKKDGADANDIGQAVALLQELKINSGQLTEKLTDKGDSFSRKSFDDLMIRKMYIVPSFEIHGGVKGLFDLGPPATALKVRTDQALTTSKIA